ncbi:MAG TPA: hypothetical protein VD738_10985 [Nitrospira sp.]|nr:hypothetical protein [Nitrospira sp.]
MVHERMVAIDPNHPSLAGHFPGHPVVPGVVLLHEVLDTLRRGSTAPVAVTGLPIVKFAAPLRPGEVMTIRVCEEAGVRATFSCVVGARLIASGVIEFATGMPARAEQA